MSSDRISFKKSLPAYTGGLTILKKMKPLHLSMRKNLRTKTALIMNTAIIM